MLKPKKGVVYVKLEDYGIKVSAMPIETITERNSFCVYYNSQDGAARANLVNSVINVLRDCGLIVKVGEQ